MRRLNKEQDRSQDFVLKLSPSEIERLEECAWVERRTMEEQAAYFVSEGLYAHYSRRDSTLREIAEWAKEKKAMQTANGHSSG